MSTELQLIPAAPHGALRSASHPHQVVFTRAVIRASFRSGLPQNAGRKLINFLQTETGQKRTPKPLSVLGKNLMGGGGGK